MSAREIIAAGSLWLDTSGAWAPGSKLGRIKVMAVVDGYVMARRLGCAPFCEALSSFEAIYTRSRPPKTKRAKIDVCEFVRSLPVENGGGG